jgi:hypothetical protein
VIISEITVFCTTNNIMSDTEPVIEKTWEERMELFRHLETLDLENVSLNELEALYKELIIGLKLATFPLPEGTFLFRAIEWEDKPLMWKDIIYPSKELAKMNRANEEGLQVFYSSTVKKSVFHELDFQAGKKYIISKWINEDYLVSLQCIGYNLQELHELAGMYHSSFNFENVDDELRTENNADLQAFLKNKFSKKLEKPGDYKASIAIAKIFYDSNIELGALSGRFDGLIYHTTSLEDYAANILLRKDVIDSKRVRFDSVEYIEVIGKNEGTFTYKLLDYAEKIKEEVIQWKNFDRTWILDDESDDVTYREDGDDGNFYTFDGEIIPHSIS